MVLVSVMDVICYAAMGLIFLHLDMLVLGSFVSLFDSKCK